MHLRCFRGALQPHEIQFFLLCRRERCFSATHFVQQQHESIRSANTEGRVPEAVIDKPQTSERDFSDGARSKAPNYIQTHGSPEHGLRPILSQENFLLRRVRILLSSLHSLTEPILGLPSISHENQ